VAEQGPLQSVVTPPHHPYIRLLLSSVPEMRPGWLEDVIASREAMTAISRAVEITDVWGVLFSNAAPWPLLGFATCRIRRCALPLPGIRYFATGIVPIYRKRLLNPDKGVGFFENLGSMPRVRVVCAGNKKIGGTNGICYL
jgi:hypothetical protein